MASNTFTAPSYGNSLEDLSSNNLGTEQLRATQETEKGKNRTWVVHEEQSLMLVLKQAKASGLKAENGWKASYKHYLWTELNKLLPGTDLQVSPHIESKLRQWKREYACLSSLLDKSGCGGWELPAKRIICSQEMWNSHVQGHQGMLKKKNYSWPLYDDWVYVFGKDRANGKGAMDVREAAKKFIPDIINKANAKKAATEGIGCNTFEFDEGDEDVTSIPVSNKAKSVSTPPITAAEETFLTSVTKILNNGKAKEDATYELRTKINEALAALGLTDRERVMLGRRISRDESLLHYFFSLNDVDRAACAQQELEEIGYRPY